MMKVLLRGSLNSYINQSLRRDPSTKFVLISQWLTRIGYLTLSLKGKKVVFQNVRNPIVQNVVRGIWVSVLLGWIMVWVWQEGS